MEIYIIFLCRGGGGIFFSFSGVLPGNEMVKVFFFGSFL